MQPIAFVSDDDPDVLRLARALERTFPLVILTPPVSTEEIKRLAAVALVIRTGPGTELSHMAETLRQEDGLPVLTLLEPEDVESPRRVAGDDFAIRPWWLPEVVLRLQRLLETNGAEDDGSVLRWGRMTLDHGRHEVRIGEAPIDLTYTEFRLLALLMERAGRVVTREVIFKDVWGSAFFGGVRTVDVHIRRLRSKLEEHNSPYIATVRNVGYRLVE